ncbi:MAG: hypothetical protein ACON47_01560 [Flavobacteriaceae bacterium]
MQLSLTPRYGWLLFVCFALFLLDFIYVGIPTVLQSISTFRIQKQFI